LSIYATGYSGNVWEKVIGELEGKGPLSRDVEPMEIFKVKGVTFMRSEPVGLSASESQRAAMDDGGR